MVAMFRIKLWRWSKNVALPITIPTKSSTGWVHSSLLKTSPKSYSQCRSSLSIRLALKPPPRPSKLSTAILPLELWLKKFRYALRLTGVRAVDLKIPSNPNTFRKMIYLDYFEDRRACQRVCQTFNSIVTEITMEYIVLRTQAELESTVDILEANFFTVERKRLVEWTTRIDSCTNGSYDPDWVLRLLALTSNLLIYTTNTSRADIPNIR